MKNNNIFQLKEKEKEQQTEIRQQGDRIRDMERQHKETVMKHQQDFSKVRIL